MHSIEWKGQVLGVLEMRKHYANYFKGIHHFKPFRLELVTRDEPEALFEMLDKIEERFAAYVFES